MQVKSNLERVFSQETVRWTDHAAKSARYRIFAGSTQTSSDIANVFRHQFRVIGVPVIEL